MVIRHARLVILESSTSTPKTGKYNLLEKIEKTSTNISILDIIKISNVHKDILYQTLQGLGVPLEVDPTHLQVTMENIIPNEHIFFNHREIPTENPTHNLPLYIEVVVTRNKIKRVLMDNGSGFNIYTLNLVKQLGHTKADLDSNIITITTYDNAEREPVGTITLPMEVGPTHHQTKFHVLDLELSYNTLLGHPWIHVMYAMPSTFHQCIRLNHGGHTITIQGDSKSFAHYRDLNSFTRKGTYACPFRDIAIPL